MPQFAYEFNDTNGELEVFADADYAAGEEKGGKETPCPVCDAVCGAVWCDTNSPPLPPSLPDADYAVGDQVFI